jgi:uncharacterized repeat protein (TIGR01451 family)
MAPTSVKVQDFTDVGAISMVLNYDPSVLAYQSVTLNAAISAAGSNGSFPGQFRLGYFGDTKTLDNDAVLFTLRFKILSPVSVVTTDLTWSTEPGDCEYASPDGAEVYDGSTFNNLTWTIVGTQACSVIDAIPDEGSVNGGPGGTAVANVLANDKLNGVIVVPAEVNLSLVSPINANITLSGSAVAVAAGTPAGTYTLTYRICEKLNPANCDEATVTIAVTVLINTPMIDVIPDEGSVNGGPGGTAIPNVLANDLINGSPVIPSEVTLSGTVPDPNGYLTLNADGSVTVAPGTPAGTYYLTYRICEVLNPANCDEATVTVPVTGCEKPAISCPAPVTAYTNDGCTASGVALGTPVTSDNSGIASVTNDAPAAFPPGVTTVTWTVTDNSSNVVTCTQTVTVSSPIIATNDTGAVIDGLLGGTSLLNVLSNDMLNCSTATLDHVILTFISSSNKDKIYLSGTNVVVASGLATGNYELVYQICDKANPANCALATVTVPVVTSASSLLIEAVNDAGSVIGGGIAVSNVLANDKLNGLAVVSSQVNLSVAGSPNAIISLNGSQVVVAPLTPAGTYYLTYRICEKLNPTNCDEAIVTVIVTAPVNTSLIDAVPDAGMINGLSGGTAVANVLANDKLNGNLVFSSQVTITFVSSTSLNVTLVGTSVIVAPHTPAGIYSLVYKICDVLNPGSCGQTTVTVTVKSGLNTELVVTKAAVETGYSAVGDLIHYNILVTNSGTVNSYYNLLVNDPNGVIASGNPIGVLAPGKNSAVTAIHTVTQADLDAGTVVNTATLNGSDPDGISFISTSNTVTVNGLQRPQITITKFATETAFLTVGEVIHYTFEVFNCGNVTAANIVVSDPKAVILTGSPVSSLAPRHTVTATAEHVVTKADVDAGKIVNIASAAGIDPTGKTVRDDSNEVTLYSNQPAKLVVTKFAKEASFKAKGDTIHYEIAVKNYRNTTLSDVVVTDPNATITSGSPIFRLASGKTAMVTAVHIITQKDLDAGKVTNVAGATGRDIYNFVDKATSNEVTVFAKQTPVLVLIKTVEETFYRNIGDLIHYNNEIKNTGNVKITGITLTDPNTSATGNNQIASLNPGGSVTIRTTHTISQADLNLGEVGKTASISGYDANSQPIRTISNQVIVKGIQNAQLATSLTAAENTYSLEGDMIHYTIEVRNTGNVTLTNLNITDATTGLTNVNSISGMIPGAVSVVTVEHMVTLADLVAGKVINLATATGYNPVGEKVSNLSNQLTIVANKAERLIITKTAQESSYAMAGEVIHYIITIKNNGKVPISNITVAVPDAMLSGNPMIASLSSFASTTMLAMHTVTQADLDAGLINTDATVSGKYPDGTAYSEKSNPVTVYGLQDPKLNTSISAFETSFTAIGQQINYTIRVENTGNVSLTGVDLSSQGGLAISGNGAINLTPGRSTRLSALYTVTLADLDAGRIVKSVHATATDPGKNPVVVTSNEITVMGLQSPELSSIASAVETSYSVVGEVIHYTITVKNSGNVSIISTAVTDPNAVIITARPNTILLPGESFIAAAEHAITQNDINAGKVVSTAKAEGFDLNGNTITRIGNKVTVYGMQISELVIETSASRPNFKKVGDVIDYAIQIKNLGNISIFNLGVTDPNALVSLEQPVPTLLPGESTVVPASHVVTQADMDAGKVVNVAKASGFDLNGKAIEKSGNKVTINGLQNHELTTTTEASVTTYKREGDVIVYTVSVMNSGNVTMNNISVTDAKDLLDYSSTLASLAPGESASIVTEYTVTIDDINAGKIVTAPEIACYDTNNLKFSYVSNDVTIRLAIENFNLGNLPNPFTYETTIVFDLPEKGVVLLKVYDITGREVWQIEQKEFSAGRNCVNWKSNKASTGLYFLRMICNGNQATRMMSIIH